MTVEEYLNLITSEHREKPDFKAVVTLNVAVPAHVHGLRDNSDRETPKGCESLLPSLNVGEVRLQSGMDHGGCVEKNVRPRALAFWAIEGLPVWTCPLPAQSLVGERLEGDRFAIRLHRLR